MNEVTFGSLIVDFVDVRRPNSVEIRIMELNDTMLSENLQYCSVHEKEKREGAQRTSGSGAPLSKLFCAAVQRADES